MKSLIVGLTLASAAVGCGRQERTVTEQTPESETDRLRKQIFDLQGTVSQINSLVLSDWASCASGGPDTLSTLQQNICKIAQASTVEAKLQLKGELAAFAQSQEKELNELSSRLDATPSQSDVNQLKTDLYGSTSATCAAPLAGSVCQRLNSAESRLTALESTVNNPTTGVAALNTAVASINSQLSAVINGAMLEITIGDENLAAGPLYEAVLRNPARSRLTAYVDSVDANLVIANNGFSTTNGSTTVVVTSTAHGYSVGNVVSLGGVSGSVGGVSSAALSDQYVLTAVTANTFSFTVPSAATSSQNGGGNSAFVRRVNGRGLGRAWQTSDGEVLLTTTFSNKPYKFVVTGASTVFTVNPDTPLPTGWAGLTSGPGFVCWSKTDRNASAATIKAGGTGIRCK